MTYIKVAWRHTSLDDPVLLYSELDGGRWEIRKVEVFPDGSMGYAASNSSFGGTDLGKVPVPSLSAINTSAEFDAQLITSAEFEKVWEEATKR
jgi:hypothetical protein